jgi:dihydroneopterin aldolase
MTVTIENIAVNATIGILPSEREKPQRVVANAKIEYDYVSPSDFVDYALIADLVSKRLTEGGFGLLEEAVTAIGAEIARLNPSIVKAELSIEKPDVSPLFRAKVTGQARI